MHLDLAHEGQKVESYLILETWRGLEKKSNGPAY